MTAPLPLAEPAVGCVLAAGLLCWLALEVLTSRRSPAPDSTLDRGSRYLVVGGYVAGMAAATAVAVTSSWQQLPAWPAMWGGLTLIAGGLLLRVWAIGTLGPWFTYDVRVQPGQRLVTSGPYRLVRHPSYTGALLAALGFGISLGSAGAAAVAFAFPLCALWPRVRLEEAAMGRAFGSAYAAYARTVPRFVPSLRS